jgi:hypothetical protein
MGACFRCGRDNGRADRHDASLCSRCLDIWCREVQEVAEGVQAE